MSPPTMKVRSCSGASACSLRRVSTVHDGPGRSASTRETLSRSSPATASSQSRTRCPQPGSASIALCGGSRTGASSTWSSSSCTHASCAHTRWPTWGGLNVPPRMPTRKASAPDLAHPVDQVLERAQLAQADRPARVQLLRRVADLGAHAELAAVGEAGRRVDVDARRVDAALEGPRARRVVGDDRLAVAGAVRVDVLDRLLNGVDDA